MKNMKVIRKTSLLAFIATVFALPIFLGGDSHADTFKTNVDIAPKLMVTLPSSPTQITVDPSYTQFDWTNLQIQISTNNPTGYYTTASSETTNLIKREDSSKFIPTIEESGYYSSSSFPVNHWGYSTDNGNTYQPFVSGTRIAGKDTAANGDTVNMRMATKVDYLQSPGTYEIELTFVTVVNYLPPSYIQDVDPMTCMEEPRTVVDMRDGEEYTIQKLNDGRCWMLDNLRLDPTEVSLNDLKGKTNAPDEALTYLKNGGGTGDGYPIDGVVVDDRYYIYEAEASPIVSTLNKDTVIEGTPGAGSGKAGVFYNFCAASAGTYCYSDSANKGDATYDICPAGWHLPKGIPSQPDSEFYRVAAAYKDARGDYHGLREALSIPGVRLNGTGELTTYGSEFWTPHWSYYKQLWTAVFNTEGNYTWGDKDTYTSQSIRCILDEPDISQATYLQDVKRAMVYNMNVGDTATLTDKRDGEQYLVSKLPDGRLWMMDNLRLDPTQVTLETLKGNTNASDSALTYLKNGGGTSSDPYSVHGVAVEGSENGSINAYVRVQHKDFVNEGTPDREGVGSGKVGVFYNYCAVSAGTRCHNNASDNKGGTTDDVCPKGWRLPTGSLSSSEPGEYENLYNVIAAINNRYYEQDKKRDLLVALSLPVMTSFADPTTESDSYYGEYWTSTNEYGEGIELNMSWTRSTDYTGGYFWEDKYPTNIFPIRCILK